MDHARSLQRLQYATAVHVRIEQRRHLVEPPLLTRLPDRGRPRQQAQVRQIGDRPVVGDRRAIRAAEQVERAEVQRAAGDDAQVVLPGGVQRAEIVGDGIEDELGDLPVRCAGRLGAP
jgi:hypothetical protein